MPFDVPPAWPQRLFAEGWSVIAKSRIDAARAALRRDCPELSARFVEELCLPLSLWLASRTQTEPLVAALSGPPGAGKSTLARALQLLLEQVHCVSSAGFSLDDVYYTKAERQALARTVHPLLATRGVPGTHDLRLAHQLLDQLHRAAPDHRVRLPRFDKLADDRAPLERWPAVDERPDIILIDGWFWGAAPSDAAALEQPINEREAADDPDGRWRRHVNAQLGGPYRALFARADVHVQLTAPNWQTTLDWRVQQQLALRGQSGTTPDAATRAQITHFLRTFERVAGLPCVPAPDLVLALNRDHELASVSG